MTYTITIDTADAVFHDPETGAPQPVPEIIALLELEVEHLRFTLHPKSRPIISTDGSTAGQVTWSDRR